MPTENDEIKVARLEEQMKFLAKGVDVLGGKIDLLTDKIDNTYLKKEEFTKFYRDEFTPVQSSYSKLVWWIISVLIASLGALILAIINYYTTHR